MYGETVYEIEQQVSCRIHKILTELVSDTPEGISTNYGQTSVNFSKFWHEHSYDFVFCLGDRYEMSAAVQASIPFLVKLAHIHGGETTLGAIDNIYRDQISMASSLHFTAADVFSEKVKRLKNLQDNIFTVGSLSLDDISDFKPQDREEFLKKFNIIDAPFLLVTFHPETIDISQNGYFASEMKNALLKLSEKISIVVTMPNADTLGSVYRSALFDLKGMIPDRIRLIENFGKINYFNAMYYSKGLLGNTSSGIIEAASFGKYVVNVGNRQKGRLRSKNIIQSNFTSEEIVSKTLKIISSPSYKGKNVYYKNGAANAIIKTLKELHD
jgi:GDP/UDP-N,N'-diacetylbacillosamine 2-epimerase (hydrolysing)